MKPLGMAGLQNKYGEDVRAQREARCNGRVAWQMADHQRHSGHGGYPWARSLVGTGVGTLFFIMAIQQAGAGRTAVLTSTAPLMAIPFSMLWLSERPTRWTLAGTVLTTTGIVLVV
jgi:drug/metabolite transporter (DMT)-like permease